MDSFGVAQSFKTWYGAILMGLILCMSVYMIALAMVRFRFFSAIKVNAQKLLEEVLHALETGEAVPTSNVPVRRRDIDPPLQILAYTALANRTAEPSDLQELMKVTIIRQKERLDRGQSAFGTMAAIGPFLGLLATVLGIIHSFEALAKGGAAGPNVVATGVAEALWGTAAGLVLAIPSVIFYNLFSKKSKALLTEMELTARELLVVIKSAKSKGPKTARA
jgi:biopolymer transport protein ExbB